ncbi:SUMF1/EgtB/PvdO family nonheme iron enzyme [Thiorhodococcus fuscus]|uniref:SUMF1/EgtB/PvdO family nonheme iron enzyme n=1 Tax=Thiorhodococcus fuscus TaxID=527200 RepID=A0ABW4YDM3_9GAMM
MPSELSRADLLRVLTKAPSVPATPMARLLGWDSHEVGTSGAVSAATPSAKTGTVGASAPVRYLSRPALVYWHLVGCEPLTSESAEDRQDDPARAGSGSEAVPEPAPPPDPRIPPLLNAGEWQNLWDRLPSSRRPGRAIDLRASLRRLARAEPLRDLPRLSRRGFNRSVTLVLGRSAALRPVWDDMRLAKRTLAALLGGDLQTFLLPAGPEGPWLESPGEAAAVAERPSAALGIDANLAAIPDGALVVLIGAFGALDSAEIEPDWLGLFTRLGAAGHPLLLVPVCPLRQTALPAAPLDPAQGRADRDAADPVRDTLLAALSQTWLPTPARLRHLRRAIPGADLHTELRAYNAPDVFRDAFHLWLNPDRLAIWLHEFARLPRHAPLRRVIEDWRRGLDAGAQAIERLQSNLLDPGSPVEYRALVEQAREVAAGLDGPSSMARAQLASMLPVLDKIRDPHWLSVQRDVDQLRRFIGLGTVADAEAADAEASSHTLVQRGADLRLRSGSDGLLSIGPRAYSLETGRLVEGMSLAGQRTLTVIDRGQRWRLATTTRPRWAERVWSDGRDLFAAHADNAILRWQPAAPGRPVGAWQAEQNPWPWGAEIGADDFGLWARLEVRGVSYRLRWIPAGRFLMGSPSSEPERDDDETQHEVTLTDGFWLGETAVHQALWRAVMGDNPSRFKGDDLPVEQVSWDDCQRFIAKLASMVTGLEPALPIEAQWEYACCAGTRTAFSFGDALDTELANYDGNSPYNDGPKGEYRQRTLPVRSFAPNSWGLYQMHGNVYEWCADCYGAYPAGPVSDPTGPADGSSRVLRGGSWKGYGRILRSAYRDRNAPGLRGDFIGLRLAGGVDRQAVAGAMTADGRERSDRPVGGQGAGGASALASRHPEQRPKTGLLRDWLRRLRSGDKG